MTPYLSDDFLLQSDTARRLYRDHAADLPIIDYHCHIDPRDIACDRRYDNIAQLWLGGDHYKWRLMRLAGIEEKYITGNESDDRDKFRAFAKALPLAVGNPVYHWAHLELKRYFDCGLALDEASADTIWEQCNAKLRDPAMSVRGIIEKSRVRVIGTTDDPADSLEWHRQIAADKNFATRVLPSFRPDRALGIDRPGFIDYIGQLSQVIGITIRSLDDLHAALVTRLDHFADHGCLISDHGFSAFPYYKNAEAKAEAIFAKALSGRALPVVDIGRYQTALLLFLGRQYAKRGWVMQLHYGVLRGINTRLSTLGPDSGFDAISGRDSSHAVIAFLDALERTDELPKTVLYSLNPGDDPILAAIAASFPGPGVMAKVQHGSAWWHNDTKQGIEAQMTSLAGRGLLGTFIGMLTDSRSFLSYTRHEYFRRILCNMIGSWVEGGEYPDDEATLARLINNICYDNAARYFSGLLESR